MPWYIQHPEPSTRREPPEPQTVRDAYDALLALQAVEQEAEAQAQA